MAMPTRSFITAALVVTFAAAAAFAQKVTYDFDKTADFTKFRTFSFREGTKSNNPLVDDRIVAAIAGALTARGMARDDAAPDLVVVTHLTFEKSKDISMFSTAPYYGGYGWGWGGGWGSTDIRVHDIVTGTLIIDLVDVAKGSLIWRGIGTKEVKSSPKPKEVDKNVNKGVTKILRNFPPPTN